jgi:Major Facilitator Superfamily
MFYIQLIIYGASAPVIFLLFRETRGPVILSKRAGMTRTLAERVLVSPRDTVASVKRFIYGNIIRPFRLLFTEPVVFVFTLLSALSYGIVFISTQSVTQVYATNYGWEDYQAGLVQASIIIGEFVGFIACLVQNRIYSRAAAAHCGQPNSSLPEVRLYLSIPGSFVGLTGGIFWYGWTNYGFLPWILPSVGLGFIGFGTMVVMQAIMMYITDAYTKYAGSASAAVCFGENVFAAFLPLSAMSIYTNLGFQWATSLLAFLALVLSFAPVVLVLKGEDVRRRSPFMSKAIYE